MKDTTQKSHNAETEICQYINCLMFKLPGFDARRWKELFWLSCLLSATENSLLSKEDEALFYAGQGRTELKLTIQNIYCRNEEYMKLHLLTLDIVMHKRRNNFSSNYKNT
jgi:hypothetical protein